MYSSSSQGGGVGVRVLTQARPTMPCISLVVLITHLLVIVKYSCEYRYTAVLGRSSYSVSLLTIPPSPNIHVCVGVGV